ncbi:outer membrane beta-barrel protein [Bacteroides coprosuis]|uniref:outer membrane beta-barrel protein n=2 Tax=Bacteroides TaxID=816 RepID=UPI001D20DB89|nr:outer membrane beta-barrel protein [Bacteroides coprosuis]HJD93198.1 porin family protein [Bacteroides coprosuis]
MKKLFLVATLVAFCATMSAQGLKGTWFAGGMVDFGKTEKYIEDVKVKNNTYGIMPLLGKFVTPDVAVGGALGFHQSKFDSDNKNTTFTIMPLARKYWNITGNLYVFGQAALPIGIGNDKMAGMKTDQFSMHFQLAPGFDLIVNKWMTIEASFTLLNAGFTRNNPDGGEKTTDWSINGNSIASSSFGDLSVGVKFLF